MREAQQRHLFPEAPLTPPPPLQQEPAPAPYRGRCPDTDELPLGDLPTQH